MEIVNDKSPATSSTTTAFNNVLVSTLDESGRSQPKYTFPVYLVAEYDPEVNVILVPDNIVSVLLFTSYAPYRSPILKRPRNLCRVWYYLLLKYEECN